MRGIPKLKNSCLLFVFVAFAMGSAVKLLGQGSLPCFATEDDLNAYVHQHPPQGPEDFQKYSAQRAAIEARPDGGNPCAAPEAKPSRVIPPPPSFQTISVGGKPLLAPDGTAEGPVSGNSYGLAFGDNRVHVDNGLLTSRGTYTYGGAAFVWTYKGADPRPSAKFVVVPIGSRGQKIILSVKFLGWNSNGEAFILVDAEEAREFTVGTDGKIHSDEPAATTSVANILYGRVVKVQPDASFGILPYATPAPAGLWTGDFTAAGGLSDEKILASYNAILAHNVRR
jgi:hypothetical protein